MLKTVAVCCVMLLAVDAAIVKRQAATAPPSLLTNLQTNMDQLRKCVDQSLGAVVGQVNEQQLRPIFNVVGETLNKVSKAFDDLTATTSAPS